LWSSWDEVSEGVGLKYTDFTLRYDAEFTLLEVWLGTELVSYPVPLAGDWNVMQISIITAPDASFGQGLHNMVLDGFPLPEFFGVHGDTTYWSLTNRRFSQGFELTGTIVFYPAEETEIDIVIGTLTP
jgi:hypothetical protein